MISDACHNQASVIYILVTLPTFIYFRSPASNFIVHEGKLNFCAVCSLRANAGQAYDVVVHNLETFFSYCTVSSAYFVYYISTLFITTHLISCLTSYHIGVIK